MAEWPKLDAAMMTKDLNMCFGCGKKNPIGLKLAFAWNGETATAEFVPESAHQGWAGMMHGGLIQALLDEGLSYAAHFSGFHCVTAEMQSRLKRPALIGEPLVITSSVKSGNRKLVRTQATITLRDGTLVAAGTATHFVFEQQPYEEFKKRQMTG
jgi:acyl-coenzyme A thioesterase PaaI-like protein